MNAWRPLRSAALALTLVASATLGLAASASAVTTVTLPGSFQSELGCPGDWQPECMNTALAYDSGLDRWVGNFTIPAGSWEYKVAHDGTWDVNYGAGGVQNGANIPLFLATEQNVTFVYDPNTNVVTQSVAPIVVAPGSFQSELGCAGDWDPACLNSQLLDLDADGVFTFTTLDIPAGSYESKIALGLSWVLNYGEGGVAGGTNLAWAVPPGGASVTFHWNSNTLVPWVTVDAPTPTKQATWGRLKVLYR